MSAASAVDEDVSVQEKLQLDDIRQRTREYKSEADRLESMLSSRLGLSLSDLSPSGQKAVDILASLASTLQLKNAQQSTFISAMLRVQNEQDDLAASLLQQQRQHQDLVRKTRAIVQQLHQCQKAIDEAKESSNAQASQQAHQQRQMHALAQKADNYQADRDVAKEALRRSGIREHETHSSLVHQHQKIKDLEVQVGSLLAILKQYHGLPPDLTLAQAKVDEARQQLQQLNDQFAREIEPMNALTLGLNDNAEHEAPLPQPLQHALNHAEHQFPGF